jgi:hypothetical protein
MTEPNARIEAALSQLGGEHEPPAGWQARVLAATTTPRRTPWWPFATSAVAVAVAGAVFVIAQASGPAHEAVAFGLDTPHSKGGEIVRGDSPHVGDVVHATARGGAGYRAVWVYRTDELVAACPGDPPCHVTGDATIADVALSSTGSYTVVALSSAVPLAPPRGKLDGDVANARKAEAMVIRRPLTVR